MRRNAWALALGAVLATNGFAAAQDGTATRPPTDDGFTLTLGGAGKAADAAGAGDTELTHWNRRGYYGYRGYFGGYRGFYGGYGWGGYGYGWGGYRSFAYSYPTYYSSFYYRPAFYYPAYAYRPHFGCYGRGYYRWIGGDGDDLDAPAITLDGAAARKPADVVVPVAPAADRPGTFRYDGPASPVPQPKADATTVPVSLKKPASPYTYKAYGEK